MSSSAITAATGVSGINSCRNRHCPRCQSLARAAWIERRQPNCSTREYFHVVFTVPARDRRDRVQNKAVVYGILFRATAETLRTIAADPQHLGAEIGFFAVLHTWGQTLGFHPHLHCVVPGGGLSLDGTRWVACRRGFFLPVRVLSRLFRRLFLDLSPRRVRRRPPPVLRGPPALGATVWLCRSSEAGPSRPNGSSTRNRPLRVRNRCSTTSAAIPTALPSRISG